MNEAQERFVNYLSIFFHNSFTRKRMGTWFLDGQTLIDFITNGQINFSKIQAGLIGVNEKQYLEACKAMNCKVELVNDRYETAICHTPDDKVPSV